MSVGGSDRGRDPASSGELTEQRFVRQLRALGLPAGVPLLVQAALSSIGPVCGGAETVTRALREALGRSGTLMVYTGTPENSSTSRLYQTAARGMSASQEAEYQARMPAFDRYETPASPTMGLLSEYVRGLAGSVRSAHPQTSFAAVGRDARWLTEDHRLNSHLGDHSPLGRLYKAGGWVLMIGVGWEVFTAFHLAESRWPGARRKHYRCVVKDEGGGRCWKHFDAPDLDDLNFPELGKKVHEELRRKVSREKEDPTDPGVQYAKGVREGALGEAHCLLVPVVDAVDAADRWYATEGGSCRKL
jgi:aminoglycoside 3-N-acetyltransferase